MAPTLRRAFPRITLRHGRDFCPLATGSAPMSAPRPADGCWIPPRRCTLDGNKGQHPAAGRLAPRSLRRRSGQRRRDAIMSAVIATVSGLSSATRDPYRHRLLSVVETRSPRRGGGRSGSVNSFSANTLSSPTTSEGSSRLRVFCPPLKASSVLKKEPD